MKQKEQKFRKHCLTENNSNQNSLFIHFPFFQLDLKLNSDKGGDVTTYVTNGEWDLLGNVTRIIDMVLLVRFCIQFTFKYIYTFICIC